MDNNSFELEQEEKDSNDEQIHKAKTSHTSNMTTSCSRCSKSDRPEVLLLCDDCDDAYHLDCLHPILLSIPYGNWFCPLCEHRKLSKCLIEKLKETSINFNTVEIEQKMCMPNKSFQRKVHSSDENIKLELENSEIHINDDELMLSTSQTDKDSDQLSSFYDESKYTVSQRGRHRCSRFNIKQILNSYDENNDDSDTYDLNHDSEYMNSSNNSSTKNFNLHLPKKITRLLHHRDRLARKNQQQTKPVMPFITLFQQEFLNNFFFILLLSYVIYRIIQMIQQSQIKDFVRQLFMIMGTENFLQLTLLL